MASTSPRREQRSVWRGRDGFAWLVGRRGERAVAGRDLRRVADDWRHCSRSRPASGGTDDDGRFLAHQQLQLRSRPVRGDSAARARELLPLQAKPASERSRGAANAHPAPDAFQIIASKDRLRVGGSRRAVAGMVLWRRWPFVIWPQSVPRRSDWRSHGAFDGDRGIRPSVPQFVAYAAPWEPIRDDGLPRHQECTQALTRRRGASRLLLHTSYRAAASLLGAATCSGPGVDA